MGNSPLVRPLHPTFPRRTLCALIGLPENAFKTMRLRGQVPLVWRGTGDADNPEEEAARGYDPLSAFALIVALEAFDRHAISRERAAFIGALALYVYGRGPRSKQPDRWPDVARTSADLAAGKPTDHILLAFIDWPDADPMPKAIKFDASKSGLAVDVGTLAEISKRWPNASSVIAVSLTRCAALLRHRAEEIGLDLSGYWDHG